MAFDFVDLLDFADIRDVDSYGQGIIAIAGTTDNAAPTGRVIVGDVGSTTELALVDFGSDYHKATIEIWEETIALLGLSEAGFKVLDLNSPGAFIEQIANPAPNKPGQLTNTNSVSTDGNWVVTANGEYGFRILRPNGGDFTDIDVIGYFASQLPPPGALEDQFSVNHVAMANGCFFAAAGAWGVYVYCISQEPDISVTKTADPASLSWVGGELDFDPDRTFLQDPDPPEPGEFLFSPPTCDVDGPNDVPAQVDVNCMSRADNLPGLLGLKWSWDDIDSWLGKGQTGDICALLDTDADGNANFAACASIENDPDTGEIIQVNGDGAVDIYSCGDSKPDRCSSQTTLIAQDQIGNSNCTLALAPEAFPGEGDDDPFDAEATCLIDLVAPGFGGAEMVSLVTSCSFPSGQPNSNPFDCVVSVGAGFIQITKLVDPDITALFGFTLSPGSEDGTSKYAVQSGVSTALIPVEPGDDYSVTETLPSGWQLDSASCTVNDESTGDLSELVVSGIEVRRGQTTKCTFTNGAKVTGDVTFTVVVTNHGLEAVTLDSLIDDMFGDLNGTGTCGTGGAIAQEGGSHMCAFTEMLMGPPGTEHTNTVTAEASSDDGSDRASDDATVSFVLDLN